MDDVSIPSRASSNAQADFLSGGGEVGALIRAHDWSTSPLGHPEAWSQSLRTVVSLLLNSKFPMFIAWGPELGFLYNDGYAAILGTKHPAALGRRFDQIWSEIWSDISPLIDRALAGEASFHENLPLTMVRKGYEEDTWFTFSYSPVHDETGGIGGMFCACTETTGAVLSDRRLAFRLDLESRLRDVADPNDIMAAAAQALGRHLTAARVGYAELEADDAHVGIENDWRSGEAPSVAGRHNLDSYGPEFANEYRAGRAVVIEDFETDPRSAGRPPAAAHAELGVRAQLVVPLIKAGRLAALLFVHSAAPRRWTEDEAVLVREVAERTWSTVEHARAEGAMRESEGRFRQLASLLPGFVWFADPSGALHYLNERFYAYTGLTSSTALPNGWIRAVHPDDQARTAAVWADALSRGGTYEIEMRYVRHDGAERWYLVRAEPLRDDAGRITGWFGVSTDIHDRKLAEAAVAESEERFRNMADHAPVMVWTTDPDGSCTYLNRGWYEFTGQTPAEAQGLGWLDATHPDDKQKAEEIFLAANARRQPFRVEYRLRRADGEYHWGIDAAAPRFGERGEYLGYIGSVIDISERKRAEEHLRLMVNELNHRVKNMLATVQAIAWQTMRNTDSFKEACDALSARLRMLSNAHDILTEESWAGANLGDVVAGAVRPHDDGGNRFRMVGPRVRLAPQMALSFAMALHELCTNAVKYGALSNQAGRIDIEWSVTNAPDRFNLRFTWRESGGPPVVPPSRKGFGSRLIERGFAAELDGEVLVAYEPTGVVCTIEASLPAV